MPSAVHVANQLSELGLGDLTDLLLARPQGFARAQDLHDVADAFLAHDSIAAALRSLSRDSLGSICKGSADEFAIGLVLADTAGKPYPEVTALVPAILDVATPAEPTEVPLDASTLLHTVVAIRDVLALITTDPITMSATGGLLKADEKALATELVIPDNEVATIVWLAEIAGLARNVDRRLRVTALGLESMDDLHGVWRQVTDAALAQIPASVRRELRGALRLDETFVDWSWPLHNTADGVRLHQVIRAAEILGLVAGSTTLLGRAVLAGDETAVASILDVSIPALVDTVYVLDDLSIIAPGPITSETAAFLDTISETEARGLASKRRLDPTRILRAMANGESVESLTTELARHSLTPLTAAVTSTITDIATNTRFVSLNGTGTDTAAKASHAELGTMLLTDPRLQRLAPVKVDDFTVLYGASRDRVETALVEGRYTVVASEKPVPVAEPAPASPLVELAERLYETGLGSSHLERALMVAGKSKARVTLVVQTGDGLRTMTIEPRQVANGRVRGLDTGSDVERTVPISAIVELKAVGE
jgi:hypothetical protein